MAIVAKGSDNIWESFQVAPNTNHIVKDGGKFTVKIVKGVLRKGVLRSEFRTKILGKGVYQIKLAYDFRIETDETSDGEAVTTQLWDGGSPTNSIRWDYSNNRLFYRLYKESSRQDFDLGTVKKGENIRLGFVINAREDGNGTTEIYINGQKVVDYKGRNLYGSLDPDPYIKFGLYDDDDLPSGISERKVVFDNIIIGDSSTSLNELNLGGVQPEEPENPEEPDVPTKPEEPNDPDTPSKPVDISGLEECIGHIDFWYNRLKYRIKELGK